MSMQDAVAASLQVAFTENADQSMGALLMSWVLCAEVAGDDGQMYLHTLRSADLAAWKALGMLEAHAGDLRAAMVTKVGDDGDGE